MTFESTKIEDFKNIKILKIGKVVLEK